MFDVLTIAAFVREVQQTLLRGRVQKVSAVGPYAVALEFYAGHRWGLIIDVAPQEPRIFLTRHLPAADPEQVTPFLLLLRKYVRGARLEAAEQVPLERIIRLHFTSMLPKERSHHAEREPTQTTLIIELMGRHSNALLVADDGRILDALKRVPPTVSAARPVLPGRPYQPPPPQLKHDPRQLTPQGVHSLLLDARPDLELASLLVQQLAGMSPQMAREATFRAAGSTTISVLEARKDPQLPERLTASILDLFATLETARFEPTLYRSEGIPTAFAAIHLEYLQGFTVEHYPTISQAIEHFFAERPSEKALATDRYLQRRRRLLEVLERERARAEARLRALELEQKRSAEADQWREMGELILAFLPAIQPGQTELVVEDKRIPLNPELTPLENAQAFFERYRKAKAAATQVPELIEATKLELEYLRQLEALATLADTTETLELLQQEIGLVHGETRSPKGKPRTRKLRAWSTKRGDRIIVGRNARENDWIAFSLARPDDAWLHARGLAGAHVIVQWAGPEDPEILKIAASLAAWYSEARESTRVAVDVTKRRDVRRIPGAAPGLVRYRNERTLHLSPRSPTQLGLEEV